MFEGNIIDILVMNQIGPISSAWICVNMRIIRNGKPISKAFFTKVYEGNIEMEAEKSDLQDWKGEEMCILKLEGLKMTKNNYRPSVSQDVGISKRMKCGKEEAAKISFILIFGGCFVAQIWSQTVKFFEGDTTFTSTKTGLDFLDFPAISFCAGNAFKYDELERLGLNKDFWVFAKQREEHFKVMAS